MTPNLISPIVKRMPGECTDCGFPISVLERDVTDYTLNHEGIAIAHHICSNKIVGYCPRCHKEYEVVRKGLFFDVRVLHDYITNKGGESNVDTECVH